MANGVEPHPRYTAAVLELIRASEKRLLPFELEILQIPCSHLPSGRDKLVRVKKDGDGGLSAELSFAIRQTEIPFDFLLFVDADQSFTTGQVVKLFNECRRLSTDSEPVVISAVTTPRGCPGKFNVGKWREQPGLVTLANSLFAVSTKRLRVDWAGAGCLMIPAEVFRRLPFPWFRDRVIEYKDEAFTTGEDVGFCVSCHEHGIPIFAMTNNYFEHHTGEEIPAGRETADERKVIMAKKVDPKAAKKPTPKAPPRLPPPVPKSEAAPQQQQQAPNVPASIQMTRLARAGNKDWDQAIEWMERAENALGQTYMALSSLASTVRKIVEDLSKNSSNTTETVKLIEQLTAAAEQALPSR
jgi:hypothetical protein